ncbi:DUF679 domain membrane protein 7 [Melia azedarach]|uniref:DUF679 domain membrane protein 7 n=1 Tax=Melia azedarach TaxID=155640 RepID=A0ACC1Y723_MELAZ|nr:DUF679 domain membrane protein 7 [Melia azedarach]
MAPKAGGHKSLSTAANLANLLPTGTVLAFQALVPSFTNNGTCLPAHKYLTLGSIVVCSIACFLSSFTDSFIGDNGKLYYGIATIRCLYVFNKGKDDDSDDEDNNHCGDHKEANDEEKQKKENRGKDTGQRDDLWRYQGVDLRKYVITPIDFVHAFASLLVFLVFATGNSDVQSCVLPEAGANAHALMINLPLGVGALASFLFMLFPTKRRGIGYADTGRQPSSYKDQKSSPKPNHEPQ